MRTIEFRAAAEPAALLDASDDIQRLLDREDAEVSPPLRTLLLALDDAITGAFAATLAA
jgi:hypothetical protein